MTRFAAVLLAALFACGRGAPARHVTPEGYTVRRSVLLPDVGRGPAQLEQFEDERVTPVLRAGFERGVADDRCANPPDTSWVAFCDAIRRQPLRPALFRIVGVSGQELDTTTVERPIAELSLLDSSTTGSPLYAVTVDLSAEMGSYSGPYARLLDGRARRFEWVRARDTHTGELVEIHLPTTLKTAWRLVRRDDGRGSDILLVACRPDFEATASSDSTRLFRITYTRFAFEQAEWRKQQRSTPGFWENEGDFPVRSSFP